MTSPNEKQEKQPIDLTSQLIQQIEKGIAPWQKPWKAGELEAPINGESTKEYNGFNFVNLLSKDYNDPRWLTFKQANKLGHKVKKGERSTPVRFVSYMKQVEAKDKDGNVIKDEQGNSKYEWQKLDRPQVKIHRVFNATQIEGIEPHTKQEPSWNPVERAENLIENLRRHVDIEHNRRDSTYFNATGNSINIPNKSNFATPKEYYATVLHETAHWVRYLNKTPEEIQKIQETYKTPEGRGKEEVIADIASLKLCMTLGLDYEPQKDLTYSANWAQT